MSEQVQRLDTLVGDRINDTVAGNAVTKLVEVPEGQRRSVFVTNNDASVTLWVTPVNHGAEAPTITGDDHLFPIAPSSGYNMCIGGGIDLYGKNSSGDATTSYFTIQQWR